MKRVLLVCSVHHDTGLANGAELHSLLERIRPEVILLEIPPAHLDDYINRTPTAPEATAAGRYRTIHRVQLVPVDQAPLTPPEEFKRSVDYLFDCVEKASPEYCSLEYWYTQFVGAFGFAYLNSAANNALWSAIHSEMRTAVEGLGDRELIELHTMWAHTNKLREEAMMKGVDDFCRQNSFQTGVWFVGASHRQSVIELSRREGGAASHRIEWDIAGFFRTESPSNGP